METSTFDIVHSILADHSFNLDVYALVGKVHTISAKRKTISTESIQFRKCLMGFCKRVPSSRLPSLDRPNFHVKQTCDPVSNQRRFPNSGGQLQVRVGSGQRCLCGAWLITVDSISGQRRSRKYQRPTEGGGGNAPSTTPTWPAMIGSATLKKARDGMVNLRPLSLHRRGRLQAARQRSAPSVGRREQGPAGDVSGGQSLHLFPVNYGNSARSLEIVQSIFDNTA